MQATMDNLALQRAGGERDDEVLKRLLDTRYSCRAFRAEPVPQETILRILEIAARTASNNNAQPWQIIITSGSATDRFRDAFFHAAQNEPWKSDYPTAEHLDIYKQRSRACGLALYGSVGIGREDKEKAQAQRLRNFQLFDAPHAAIITSDVRQGPFGVMDCGAYINNFVLAARSLGVDSIAQGAFAQQADFLRGYFGLSDDRVIVNGISFGYEDKEHPVNCFRTGRAPIEEIVTFVSD